MGRCKELDCLGDVVRDGQCIAHVPSRCLHGVLEDRESVNARRCSIKADRVQEIVDRLCADGRRLSRKLDLSGATVRGVLTLSRLKLDAGILLSGANIGELRLGDVRGLGHLSFGSEWTHIGNLRVQCHGEDEELEIHRVDAASVRVHDSLLRRIVISGSRLGSYLDLNNVDSSIVEVRECAFRNLHADHLTVGRRLTIRDCLTRSIKFRRFGADGFFDISSTAAVDLYRGTVAGPATVTWMSRDAVQRAWEDRAFAACVDIETEHHTDLVLSSVQFGSTAHLKWCSGKISLPSTVFSDASTLAKAASASNAPWLESVDDLKGQELRIVSARIAHCPLSQAVSLGPINVASLRFGTEAAGWARRHYIHDEFVTHVEPDESSNESEQDRAARLTATYRQLRKRLEAIGEHAGANDLHYGERVWQRKATGRHKIEYWWLTAYGIAGYGVRPWRPLVLLAGLVALAVAAFSIVGGLQRSHLVDGTRAEMRDTLCKRDAEPTAPARRQRVRCDADLGQRLEFVTRATTSIVRPVTDYRTTGWGVVVEIGTRLLAALLFALFLLAVRNRVRR